MGYPLAVSTKHFVGIDLGAESGRVMLGTFDGHSVTLSEMHRFNTGGELRDGELRWDVDRFWSEIKTGLKVAAENANGEIVSIGVDTWGVDFVLFDKQNQPIDLPWHYRDSRTSGIMEEVLKVVPRQEVFRKTGIQFLEFNSLYQLLAEKKKQGSLDHVGRILTIPDYLHWKLCGSTVAEFTNATTTQCFNPSTRDWAVTLLSKLDIPTDIFPKVVQPGTVLGTLRDEIAAETGLGNVNVVAPPAHDTASAVAAAPACYSPDVPWAYVSSGTWSLVGIESPVPILSADALRENVTNEGGVDGTWRVLKNVMGLWLVQQLRASFERRGQTLTYAEMVAQAATSEPMRSLVDPDRSEFLNPEDMLEAVENFCRQTGQPIPETVGQAVRCVLESLALKYQHVLRSLEKLGKRRIEVIHVVGGGCQNELLNQLIANACQIPVIAGPVEATVLGNILVQCKAAGEIASLQELRDIVRRSSELKEFRPERDDLWKAAEIRFRELSTPVAITGSTPE